MEATVQSQMARFKRFVQKGWDGIEGGCELGA